MTRCKKDKKCGRCITRCVKSKQKKIKWWQAREQYDCVMSKCVNKSFPRKNAVIYNKKRDTCLSRCSGNNTRNSKVGRERLVKCNRSCRGKYPQFIKLKQP